MLPLPRRFPLLAGLMLIALSAASSQAAAQAAAPVLHVDGLGKGTAPLDGPWQFHLGDNPGWASAQVHDETGSSGWEQLSPDMTWGAQGHSAYTGYAWYRKHLHLAPAPGASPEFAMLIRQIDDAYEIYWNGQLIGRHGTMPPSPSYPYSPPAQTFGLGPVRDGVLALRVWKAPLTSFDSDLLGGLYAAPILGSPADIAAQKAELDYTWMRSRQYYFGMQSLYALVMVLGLLAWFRNRSERVLLWISVFSGAPLIATVLVGLRLPLSYNFALGWLQPVLSLEDIGLWFLLLYLLKLDDNILLARMARSLAILSLCSTTLDGLLTLFDWSKPWLTSWVQLADGVLTLAFTATQLFPMLLIAYALRKRLDSARWLMAGAAFLREMIFVVRIAVSQGSRYTHWTIANKISAPLFVINGNVFMAQTLADTLLLLAIIYAVYRYMQESTQRQSALEQEFKSARELQQVLIPETLPELPGFAVTSAYRPAQEVGGDFFQIIPLEGEFAGSTLILLGDVSGKGLKAAMTVSLIVGSARTLARFASRPADLLAELNLRLYGRMQGGFTTCLAMRLGPDGHCTIASAGHPAPFLNQREIDLPGTLPLGVVATAAYKELVFHLKEGDHFALYTDGLLEARNASGEIFSFERLDALFATRPNAAEASEAAVKFGQDDDITVLTLTRLASGQQSTTELTTPIFSAA
jgi:hypothetical protein